MVLTLELPDNIAQALTDHSDRDLARRTLEALAVDGYRERRLTQKQVRELLGLSRMQVEDFLARMSTYTITSRRNLREKRIC